MFKTNLFKRKYKYIGNEGKIIYSYPDDSLKVYIFKDGECFVRDLSKLQITTQNIASNALTRLIYALSKIIYWF